MGPIWLAATRFRPQAHKNDVKSEGFEFSNTISAGSLSAQSIVRFSRTFGYLALGHHHAYPILASLFRVILQPRAFTVLELKGLEV